MTANKRRMMRVLLPVLWSSATWPSYAAEGFSASEIAMLPVYCQVKRQFQLPNRPPGADVRQWEQVLGPNVTMHMHHYCGGLAWLRRAEVEFSGSRLRAQYASRALNGIDYILRAHNLPPQTPIMPDILVNRAKALFLSGEPIQATDVVRQALALKGDIVAAHELLIDIHLSQKSKREALLAAEAGLRQAPNSRRLERRYLDLGGKLPLPGTQAKAPDPVAPQPAEGGGEKTQEPDADVGGAAAAQQSEPHDPGAETPSPVTGDADAVPKKKRSCRFCP